MSQKYRDSASSGSTTHSYNYNGVKKSPLLLQILIWVITGIVISIILMNVKPYEVIAANYLAGISYSEITDFILSIWLIGAIFGIILKFANFTLGFLLWAFIQILEIIPMELLGHERFLDKNIHKGANSHYSDTKGDAWEVKFAKKLRNSLSTEVLRFLIVLGVCIYVVDFFACLTVFPPVVGGGNTWQLIEVIQYQQFNQIDWSNILRAVTTVGAVQFLLKLRKIFVAIIRDLNE